METNIRPPAVAGMFYPAAPNRLQKDIKDYLDGAVPPDLNQVRAMVVPHAGYVYSGAVAAYGYKLLASQPEPPKRIYLLGPAHRVPFHGVALTDYDAFKTPLGDHPLDTKKIQQLDEMGPIFNRLSAPHAPEHCLEVHIPFIQTICPSVPVVPMLFGQVEPHTVGKLLDEAWEPGDFMIVSSDLSHFHENEKAHTLDRKFLDALLEGDTQGVAKGEACGQAPALVLMHIAKQKDWQAHLLDYRTSGDVTGNVWEVVGYAAVAYIKAE